MRTSHKSTYSVRRRASVILASAAVFSSCQGIQSALDPAGPQSARIGRLWWLTFFTCLVVFVIVQSALFVGLRRPAVQRDEGKTQNVVAFGAVVTAVILLGLLVSDFITGREISSLHSDNPVTVKITAHQWWWDVEYEDPTPSRMVRTANEIHIPVGRPVKLELGSGDVIHSFWAPNLQGKTDLLTGHQTVTWLQADRAGPYRGQCAEYCGFQHAHMAFVVMAEPADQFDAWYDNQTHPAIQDANGTPSRGQQVFIARTCVMCHEIRGTSAGAHAGPDLTHLASRQSIGAGTLANNRENLKSWISDSHQFKPGNKMPSHNIPGDDMNALLDYLGSLK